MAFYYRRVDTQRPRWVVKYKDATGAARSLTVTTEAEAKRTAAAKTLEEARTRPQRRGGPPEGLRASMTVEAYTVGRFLPHVELVHKPATGEVYRRQLETRLLDAPVGRRTLGQMRIDQVRPLDLERLLGGQLQPRGRTVAGRVAPRTVLLLSGILSALFSLAKKDGLILDNPAHGLREQLGLSSRITEARPEVHALTEEHQARLKVALQDAPPFLARFVAFGLNSGCRIGESLGLRWQDVDEVTREMHITWTLSAPTDRRKTVTERLGLAKSGKSRRVHISAELLPILRDLRRAGMADALKAGRPFTGAAFVFARPDGTPYHQTVVRAGFRRLMRRAGLPDFSPHVLRHTFAVSLLKDGCPITLVQSLLGHASVQMTGDVYGRWVPSDDRSWIDRLGDRMRLPEAARERLVAGDAPRRRVASVSQMPAAVSQISRNPAEFLSIPTKEEVTAPVIQI